MRYEDLPERWRQKLEDYLAANGSMNNKKPGASDFQSDSLVRIGFEDASTAAFRYAFIIKAEELKEIAVFTEHCGYHIFPLYDGLNLTMISGRDASAGSA